MATQEVLQLRKEAFIENSTTSHWPHLLQGRTVAGPWLEDKSVSEIPVKQQRLIGLPYIEALPPKQPDSTVQQGASNNTKDKKCVIL